MRLRSLSFAPLLMSVALVAGCADAEPSTNVVASGQQDLVSQPTFDRAFSIVNGIDYLPFDYREDGCYARALYMSMELAAEGMESNELFAFAKGSSLLQVGDVMWAYHVAPMLEVGPDADHHVKMVIDPSLSNRPLTEDAWLTLMGKGPGTSDDDAPDMLFVPGSDYDTSGAESDRARHNHDTADFDHMPAFYASDIQSACGVMHAYLGRERGSSADTVAQKQTKLIERTSGLIEALRTRGKLDDNMLFSAERCGANIF